MIETDFPTQAEKDWARTYWARLGWELDATEMRIYKRKNGVRIPVTPEELDKGAEEYSKWRWGDAGIIK